MIEVSAGAKFTCPRDIFAREFLISCGQICISTDDANEFVLGGESVCLYGNKTIYVVYYYEGLY